MFVNWHENVETLRMGGGGGGEGMPTGGVGSDC
jgi:hypothetical protein